MTDIQNNSPGGYSVENAYHSIREQILSGEFEGGRWLREGDLASALGISRTPIREALRRLTSEGLVQHHRNRGVLVQSWTSQDLDEIFGVRSLLEPSACALAASKDIINLNELQVITDEMESLTEHERPNIAAITRLNNLFHQEIMRASGDSHLASLVESVIQVPLVRRTFSTYRPENLRRSISHHREIIDAVRAKDAIWAEAVMRAHIHAGWAQIRRQP